MNIKLSKKYKDFLKYDDAVVEILEGTTAAGKTTVGIIKFLFKVAKSKQVQHIISGQNLGVVEKNIINADLGIIDIFGGTVEYNARGKGKNTLSHLVYHTNNGDKIIYILGYDNETRWKNALGGQYGCVYIDEINTANMSYVRQVAMRCDYLMGTLNPDNPEKEIYTEYINRCRPLDKYKNDAPIELLRMLDKPKMDKWIWWYFTFYDNDGLTDEKREKIKGTHAPGTSDYRHYILGLRGRAEGIIFDNFDSSKHCISFMDALKFADKRNPEHFVLYTSGLDTAYSKNSPDTIAMSFLGLTNKGKLILLDEEVYNNRDVQVSYAPSDISIMYYDFLEKNRKTYGYSKDTFIDSADQATKTELNKAKLKNGWIYSFNDAYKKVKIIDRIKLQKGWISTGYFFVVENCKVYIHELESYSWSEGTNKDIPEDGNDHMINSVQYGFIPYRNKIGIIP